MDQLQCKRCGHASSTKSNLLSHLRRKKDCPPTLSDISREELIEQLLPQKTYNEKTYDCEYCTKKFNTRQGRFQHTKLCKQNPSNTPNASELVPISLVDALEKRVKELEQKMVAGSTNTNHGTINNNQNHGIINNITINALGKEDISYITDHPRFRQFMIGCIKDKAHGVMEYMVKKHFDPSHPENHNLKKMRRGDDFMEVHDGRQWRLRYAEDILQDIFLHMQRDFANFVEEALTEDGLIKKAWLDNFMETVGKPLDWDLSTEDYEYDGEVSEAKKAEIKNKLYKLAIEHIYRKSKETYAEE